MPLSTKWTRFQIRDAVRRELLDPNARWWSNVEIDSYIAAWQDVVQDSLECVWGSATATVGSNTSTLTVTNVASDILRLDAVYWNNVRLVGRNRDELDRLVREWRNSSLGTPLVVYQHDPRTVSFWPGPDVVGTAVFEYPKRLDFTDDNSAMTLPAWARYSAVNYCCWRAYLRHGPNHDLNRAARRKAKFLRQLARYKSIKASFLPDHCPALRPGGAYEADILTPNRSKLT